MEMKDEASRRVAVTMMGTTEDGADDWWAERLVCGVWVSTRNATRRAAEEKFGRHHQREHAVTPDR